MGEERISANASAARRGGGRRIQPMACHAAMRREVALSVLESEEPLPSTSKHSLKPEGSLEVRTKLEGFCRSSKKVVPVVLAGTLV